ncbi:MAG: aminotransferase class IV [Deltaproteobacteria bacterium]|nr:aminotransferase class IV [Deltaproteobacteria bacterium]
MRLAVIDGNLHGASEARISVFDRGFLYGDGVLETLRTYRGEPFALEAHLARLARSADALGIRLPCALGTLAEEVRRALSAAGNQESSIRVVVTRGEGPAGLDPTYAATCTRVVLVDDLAPMPELLVTRGIRLRCIQTVRAADALHSAKLTNYVAAIVATRDARAVGDDEAAIIDARGLVIEGSTFNVFAVSDGRILTPPLERGVLDGITRGLVLDLARDEGIDTHLEALSPTALADADEVFVTSTFREVLAVSHVDGHEVRAAAGPLTRRLHAAFRRRVGMDPPPYLE